MKVSIATIRTLVAQAIDRDRIDIAALSGSNNPQTVEMRKKLEAQKEAFEAVQYALNGETVFLRILAEHQP